MSQKHLIKWYDADKDITGLQTDIRHDIEIQREAIPIVFVPGIMGSRLRRRGKFTGDELGAGLPEKRWDPGSAIWTAGHYLGMSGAYRKLMLVGSSFSPDYLEVIQDDEPSNGFEGIMDDYWEKFLNQLQSYNWDPIWKIFELPVYAVGYNWTDKVENCGKKLADRIEEIISEAKKVTGLCEQVIVVTHSMGGLVSRWASEKAGANGNILGIIHGVQPVTGAPAAYWRMKAGFEGDTGPSLALGISANDVTPVLGNIPGGLSLLPNKLHRTNAGRREWLRVVDDGWVTVSLPKSDPYDEIYRDPAVVSPDSGDSPSTNPYWFLVDPDLLDPGKIVSESAPGSNNDLDARKDSPWGRYKDVLGLAERMHDQLGDIHHPQTFCSRGYMHLTADAVELRVEERPLTTFRNYPLQGFRGFFRSADGDRMQAVLQEPAGDGDGTVPLGSAGSLDKFTQIQPKHRTVDVMHQPAYEAGPIQDFTIEAIVALCEKRYKYKRG